MAEVLTDKSFAEQADDAEAHQRLVRATDRIRASQAAKQRAPTPIAASVPAAVEALPAVSKRMEAPPLAVTKPPYSDVFRAQIPGRFSGATLANFRPSTPSQTAAIRAVESWLARALSDGDAMLALIGPTGCGKSHLLYAAAHALAAAERRFYARPWYILADELRYGGHSSFAPKVRLEPDEVRAQLRAEKIALVDEVRATASTQFDDTELAKFACLAYDDRRSVLITSNVSPLELVMGPPAASRFVQVLVDGPDARQAR